jgi:hypothetical protein
MSTCSTKTLFPLPPPLPKPRPPPSLRSRSRTSRSCHEERSLMLREDCEVMETDGIWLQCVPTSLFRRSSVALSFPVTPFSRRFRSS